MLLGPGSHGSGSPSWPVSVSKTTTLKMSPPCSAIHRRRSAANRIMDCAVRVASAGSTGTSGRPAITFLLYCSAR